MTAQTKPPPTITAKSAIQKGPVPSPPAAPNIMSPHEFRAALKALGLTQRWLAGQLGVAATTVNRWATGELAVPQYAVAFLELAAEHSRLVRALVVSV